MKTITSYYHAKESSMLALAIRKPTNLSKSQDLRQDCLKLNLPDHLSLQVSSKQMQIVTQIIFKRPEKALSLIINSH